MNLCEILPIMDHWIELGWINGLDYGLMCDIVALRRVFWLTVFILNIGTPYLLTILVLKFEQVHFAIY